MPAPPCCLSCRLLPLARISQITLQLVAKDAGLDVPRVNWAASGVFDARKLVYNTDTEPGFRAITITGTVPDTELTQEQLDTLARSTSDRCPISRTLSTDVDYTVRLVRAVA